MKKNLSTLLLIVGLIVTVYGMTGYAKENTLLKIDDVTISDELKIESDGKHRFNAVSLTGIVLLVVGAGGRFMLNK